jgi:hypothetical protein
MSTSNADDAGAAPRRVDDGAEDNALRPWWTCGAQIP